MTKLHSKIFTAIILLLVTGLSLGQNHPDNFNVYFKNGTIQLDENITSIRKKDVVSEADIINNRFHCYVQFYELPSIAGKDAMKNLGIKLLEYIPNKLYVTSFPADIDFNSLKALNIRSIVKIPVMDKMDIRLSERPFPDWVVRGDEIRLLIQYYPGINPEVIKQELIHMGIQVYETMEHVNMLIVQTEPQQIEILAAQSFVRYLDFESEPGKPESDDGRNLHRSNTIDVDYHSGYDFDGTGVSAAINDDGYAGPHIDFKGRADQSDVANDFTGDHGDMTVGIVGAAGNLDPSMRGMAPGAFLWVRSYNSNLPNTVTLHQNEDVMVFSSSYSNGCNAGYTSVTQMVDEEIYDNPSLIQVFSAGNSNNNDCGYGAGSEWGNITGGHKMAKNVMATANLYNDDSLVNSSSRGPASDGRIKPDISAHGQGHWSTDPDNTYASGGGTSAAAPGIAGVIAQLHQAYRTFNNGSDAPSALIKASIMNTAYDLGNPGPDFKYGWGKVHAYKAMRTIEEFRFISDSITNGSIAIHELSVPAGVQEVRVMLYWHDVEASTSAQYALVNNLDMTITDPVSTTHQPLVLDHSPNPTTLDNPAIPGTDSINNVEQVRITNPSQGNHSIAISGTSVPFGPQDYFIVYEFYYDEIMVSYPIGGEGLIPGSPDRIHWDAHGDSGFFTAELSLDSGTTWTVIADTIPGTARFIDFQVPDTVSKAKVKISRGTVSDESDEYFSIINTPLSIQISAICSGTNSIHIVWDSVPLATAYDVFYLGTMYMDSVGTSSALNYEIGVPSTTQDHWVSVRARGPNGEVGRRAIAVTTYGPDCLLDCLSDDDAGVHSLISPASFNESCNGSLFDVVVNLTNIGPNVQSGFPVYYQIDTNAIVTDTFSNTLAGGAVIPFTFSTPISFTASGIYTLSVWTGLADDGATCNDTIITDIQFYEPLSVFPYSENFNTGSFPPNQMSLENPDQDITWESVQVVGSNGFYSMSPFMDNFNYNSVGEEDIINIVSFDLSSSISAELKFDVAHAQYSSSYSDGLRVDISTDCGQSYSQLYFKEGSTLATVSPSTSQWEPSTSGQWREEVIDLASYAGGAAKIRFVGINGYGNSLFIDNIRVESINQAPTTNFASDVLQTCNGIVYFTDLSQDSPQNWLWDFGDNTTSTDQNPMHIYTSEGVYDVTLITGNPVGSDTLSQSAYITVDFLDDPQISDTVSCNGDPVNLVIGNPVDETRWYNGGTLINTGNTFTTPSITSDVIYQVENIGYLPPEYVGPENNLFGTGGIHSSGFTGTINFVAEQELTIVSAWVEVQSPGNRTLYLWDEISGNGNIVQEVNVYIPAGTGRIDLGFHIPSPGEYSIGGSNVDMYRNSSGANYPYSIPGLITLTGSSANSGGDYYYYLYDLEIRKAPCKSALHDVLIKYVKPDYTYIIENGTVDFSDISIGATTWSWDFGNGMTSNLQNPSVSYNTTGTYPVSLEIDGDCSYSENISVSVTSIEQIATAQDIMLIPNPSQGTSELIVSKSYETDAVIQIISVDGKIIKDDLLEAGKIRMNIDLSMFSPSIYYVRILNENETTVLKLVLQ